MKQKESLPPTLVTIAGFDPSGGAGVSLDLRVFESLGFAGGAVATAVTVQNSSRVAGIFDLPARAVRAQFDSLEEDIRLAGIKVGMLGSRANVRAVAGILARHPDVPRVVDPVFRSSSGAALLDPAGIDSFLSVAPRARGPHHSEPGRSVGPHGRPRSRRRTDEGGRLRHLRSFRHPMPCQGRPPAGRRCRRPLRRPRTLPLHPRGPEGRSPRNGVLPVIGGARLPGSRS